MAENTTPTHDDWEAARELRNQAAVRFIWNTQGTSPNERGHKGTPEARKYLAEFYRQDEEMDRIAALLATPRDEAGA